MEAPRESGITRHRIPTPLSFCRNDGLVLKLSVVPDVNLFSIWKWRTL